MNRLLTAALLCGLLASPLFAQEESSPPKSVKEKASYGFGMTLGGNLKRQGLEIDVDRFVEGLRDALTDAESQLSQEEISAAMQAFEKQRRRRQALARINADPKLKALAEKNAKEGEKFLAANAEKDEIKSTESGLQYRVLESGDSEKSPGLTDVVKVHYHGKLLDGTVFDSSVERKKPATFPVNGVIDGWTEVLQLMNPGDKWRVYIPSELAYDLTPPPGSEIGPNAVLVFDVELLEIVDTGAGNRPQLRPQK